MRIPTSLLVLCLCMPASLGAQQRLISAAEFSLGGVSVGQHEREVVGLLGVPPLREDTLYERRLRYLDLDVYVDKAVNRVSGVAANSKAWCTPAKICPGTGVDVLHKRYGVPIVAKRENGVFLEYYAQGSTCWLQMRVAAGVVTSINVACQP